jgi:hypothetical protein
MPIFAEQKEGNDFITVEPGTYVARCYSMIEIGTIETEYKGTKKKQHKASVTWELPTETAIFHEEKGPEPFVVSKKYTLSMYKDANLRKDLESWRGKGYSEDEAKRFDITKLIGQPCLITVIQKQRPDDPTKTYTSVENVTKMMKDQECPPQINPTRVLSFDKWDDKIFNSLSDYMKDQIRSSDEYKRMQEPSQVNEQPEGNDDMSDLPF